MNKQRRYNSYTPASLRRTPPSSTPTRKKFSLRRFSVGLFTLLLVVAIISVQNAQRAHARAAAAEEAARRRSSVTAFREKLDSLCTSDPLVSFSVAATDLKYGLYSDYQGSIPSDAASTAKLLSASLYLKGVEEGRFSLSQRIADKPALTQLRLMVQQSDDTAWEQINGLLGHRSLGSFAAGAGLGSYRPDTNTLSASDMNRLQASLISGRLLNHSHTTLLLSMMQHTNYEDFISPAVGEGYTLYHKVGINDDQVNDTAIIGSGDDTLVITIYTNGGGSYNWPHRAALMQSLAKAAINAYLN